MSFTVKRFPESQTYQVPRAALDPAGILTVDGVRISIELIHATFASSGMRRHLVLEEGSTPRLFSSRRSGDKVFFRALYCASWRIRLATRLLAPLFRETDIHAA